jgi:hypothetical protein
MHRLTTHLFAVTLAGLSSLPAQSHTRTVPKVFTGWHAGSAHTATLARTRFFIQTWYRGDNLQSPSPISQIGWRVHSNTVAPAQLHTLEIVLTSTTATFSTLSKTFTSNLGNDATVFFTLKQVNLPAQNLPSDPDAPALWLLGDRPFVYRGPHFLVQVDVQSSTVPSSTPYLTDGYEMTMPDQTKHSVTERSCAGGIGVDYASGRWNLDVAGARPNGAVLFLIGRENTTAAGGAVSLPLDLSPLGMTGCILGVDPIILVPLAAGPTGRASLSIPVVAGPETIIVHAQALISTNLTPVGFGTTDVAHSLLGGIGLSNYVFNFSRFTPTAEYGPFPYNLGEIILLRP